MLDSPAVTRNEEDRHWQMAFKLELLEFNGGLDADEFLDWLNSVEELLEFKDVPDDRRVPLVATRFYGRALAWWHQLKTTRLHQGKEKNTSWAKLRKHMQ